jgi:glutamine---fructose-6-phosphate transaminase (isomerizing)
MFILGKGYGFSIALEASLKIKEIGYLHAEAYPSGSLKHGPFALIKKGKLLTDYRITNFHNFVRR